MCLFLRRAGGPFKPFFGLSGALLKRKLSSCLETETISRVRADAPRHLLRVPQVSRFSRPGFRHKAQPPPENKPRTKNRQLTTAFLQLPVTPDRELGYDALFPC